MQHGLFVGESKGCIFHHSAVKFPPWNALPVQGKTVASFKLYGIKLLKYRLFSLPVSP